MCFITLNNDKDISLKLLKPMKNQAAKLYPAYEARSKDNISKGIFRFNVSGFPMILPVKTRQMIYLQGYNLTKCIKSPKTSKLK